jgi:hypothetical protein
MDGQVKSKCLLLMTGGPHCDLRDLGMVTNSFMIRIKLARRSFVKSCLVGDNSPPLLSLIIKLTYALEPLCLRIIGERYDLFWKL